MKTTQLAKWVGVIAGTCLIALAPKTGATTLSIGDLNELGFIQYGIPTGDGDIPQYVNAMIGLSLGGSTTVTLSGHDNLVTRSMNAFSPLPTAVLGPRDSTGGNTVHLGTGGYYYLFAKYDGPNYGAEVWYINGLTGDITIPTTGGGYGLSGFALFTPSTNRVPDGGATALMLGTALAGLGLLKRRVQ